MFSHAQSRRLLPKGGRVQPPHLASHKTDVTEMVIIIKQHDYINTRHNTLTLFDIEFQVDVIPLTDHNVMNVFSSFLHSFKIEYLQNIHGSYRHLDDTSRDDSRLAI